MDISPLSMECFASLQWKPQMYYVRFLDIVANFRRVLQMQSAE
jgi:hypothetical protein